MSHLTSLLSSNDVSLSKSNEYDSATPDVRVGDKSNVSNKVLGLRLVDEGATQIIEKSFNVKLRQGLKRLVIKDPNFSELHLNERQKISQLEVLDLSGNTKMGTYGLSSMICATEKTLKTLILKNTVIADLCDQAYSKLSNLEHLDLSGNKIMGDQLLSTMIYFAQGNLKTLNLSNTNFSGLSTAAKIKLLNLEHLDISNTKFQFEEVCAILENAVKLKKLIIKRDLFIFPPEVKKNFIAKYADILEWVQ